MNDRKFTEPARADDRAIEPVSGLSYETLRERHSAYEAVTRARIPRSVDTEGWSWASFVSIRLEQEGCAMPGEFEGTIDEYRAALREGCAAICPQKVCVSASIHAGNGGSDGAYGLMGCSTFAELADCLKDFNWREMIHPGPATELHIHVYVDEATAEADISRFK